MFFSKRNHGFRVKKCCFLFLAAILVAALSVGCGPGTATGIRFDDYDDFKETFKDLIMYPTYFPNGYNFMKGEGQVYIGADFVDMGSYFSSPAQTPDNFYQCSIRCVNDRMTEFGAWRTGVVSLSFPLVKSAAKSKEEMEEDEEEYMKIENDQYDIYQRIAQYPGRDPGMVDPESHPYEILNIYFYFFLAETPYIFQFNASKDVLDEDKAAQEALYDYCLNEAIKIMDSLEPYDEVAITPQRERFQDEAAPGIRTKGWAPVESVWIPVFGIAFLVFIGLFLVRSILPWRHGSKHSGSLISIGLVLLSAVMAGLFTGGSIFLYDVSGRILFAIAFGGAFIILTALLLLWEKLPWRERVILSKTLKVLLSVLLSIVLLYCALASFFYIALGRFTG